jgi:aminopeptidase
MMLNGEGTDEMSNAPLAEWLERYADVIVRVGLNLQAGQRLLIRGQVKSAPLVRQVVRSAYQAGARFVDVMWQDDQTVLLRLQHAPADSFSEFPEWYVSGTLAYLQRGDAMLSIVSEAPDLLAGQNPTSINTMMQTAWHKAEPISDLIQRNAMNWTVAAAANLDWADQVFADEPHDQREQKLWDAILRACRIDRANPIEAWNQHTAELALRSNYLNARQYSALHYRGPDTDLTIGMARHHRWVGGSECNAAGNPFVPNLPTEEIFSLPDRMRADGVVRATRPLSYAGTLIDGFSLTFANGRVVEIHAERGEDLLRSMIASDEGAARLGEVALVPQSSPIAASNLRFANTLFDENAASHVALGRGYRFTVNEGTTMSDDQFAAAGGNLSAIHVDFMIGSDQIDIDGIRSDGQRDPLMRAGEWAFTV